MATFKITGDFITKTARDLWSNKEFGKAIEYLANSVEGMEREYQLQLLEGKMKLTGVNTLDFVEDGDFNKENYEYYPTLSEALEMKKDVVSVYESELISQRESAKEIINLFSNYHSIYEEQGLVSLSKEDSPCMRAVNQWNGLLKEVRDEFIGQTPFWMSFWLRKEDGTNKSPYINLDFGNLAHQNIIAHILPYKHPAWDNRKMFNFYCDKYHINLEDEREEIWNDYHNLIDVDKLVEIKPAVFEIDNEMKHQFGWLSRDGVYYHCYYTQHSKLANFICQEYDYEKEELGDYDYALEKRGWVKIHVSDSDTSKILFSHIQPLSFDQQYKINEYCEYFNLKKYKG